MPRSQSASPLPACYAHCIPGLEQIAAEEIAETLGGDVRKTTTGLVAFRIDPIDDAFLRLRTVEDVFLLAWGTDQLTCRAVDLKKIRHWTAHSVNWDHLLRIHHAVRPKPKGKPTYHLVTQMHGRHGYFRSGAQKALAQGLSGKFPSTWKPADENASVEIWLTIRGRTAYCGARLTDRTMRHRTWKVEHLPASLRPTLAAALARLARIEHGHVVVDPTCGAGTILGEARALCELRRLRGVRLYGGDLDLRALRAARINLRRHDSIALTLGDVRALSLPAASVDRIVSNPPFGKQLSDPSEIRPLYQAMVAEMDRVLRPDGRCVLLVSEVEPLQRAANRHAWQSMQFVPVEVLGQRAMITIWRKAAQSSTFERMKAEG